MGEPTVGAGGPMLRFPPVRQGYARAVLWLTVIVLADPVTMALVVVHGSSGQQHDAFLGFDGGWLGTLALLVLSAHWTMPRAPAGRRPPSRRLWPKTAAGLTIGVGLLLRALPTTAVAAFFGATDALVVFLLAVLVIDHHRWRRYSSF